MLIASHNSIQAHIISIDSARYRFRCLCASTFKYMRELVCEHISYTSRGTCHVPFPFCGSAHIITAIQQVIRFNPFNFPPNSGQEHIISLFAHHDCDLPPPARYRRGAFRITGIDAKILENAKDGGSLVPDWLDSQRTCCHGTLEAAGIFPTHLWNIFAVAHKME